MKAMTTILLMIMIFSNGCMSYVVLENSKKEIIQHRVAIKAVELRDGYGIGLDVLCIAAIKEHPWKQLGAAIIDAIIAYGCSEGIQAIKDSLKHDEETTIINNYNYYDN